MKTVVAENMSLLEALATLSPKSSKTTLRSWLKMGRVFVDKKNVKLSEYQLSQGQQVEVKPAERHVEGKLAILYEDRHIIVINKPCGLLSVATAFETRETAHALLKAKFKPRKVYVVHRLDQETSGVMLFALSEPAYENLKKAFEKHDIERKYTAIVEGELSEDEGTWKSYLEENDAYVVYETKDSRHGQLAITHFNVEASRSKYSWLTLTLETGRKNQIRVHCQSSGHPIVGDKKYGSKANPIKRLCLHAHLLAFKHPMTKKMMRFEAPIPETFQTLVKKHV